MRSNRWIGALILLAGVGIYLEASRYAGSVSTDPVGPAAYPKFLGLLIALLGLVLALGGTIAALWRKRRGAARGAAPDEEQSSDGEERQGLRKADWVAMAGIVFPVAGYLLVLDTLGFLPATLLLVAVLMWVNGERRWTMLVGGNAAITVIVYLLFGKVLNVLLPTGIFPVGL